MLWSAFRAQIRRELEESTATVWSDDSLLYWANESAKDIAIRAKCSRDWQYTTAVAGQEAYELPVRSLEVIEVFFGDGATVGSRKMLTRQDFHDWAAIDVTDGTPTAYAIDDQYLYLRPAPTSAYEISFLRYTYPEDIDADGDSMPYADAYNTAIGYYIKSKAKEQIDDWDGADRLLGRYMDEVDKIAAQEQKEATANRYMQPTQVW